MREHSNNHVPRSDTADWSPVSARTELLRAAADGELTPAQTAELERHVATYPDDQRVIDFERELRVSVAASASETAPTALRDRIAAMSSTAGTDRASLPLPSAHTLPHRRFSRSILWMAIAASVALVAGGAFLTLRQHDYVPADGALITQQYRTSLVSFIGTQHQECEVHADMIGMRFKTTKLVDVPSEFAKVLGSTPDIGHIEGSGFKLLGAGPCAVPGRGKSVRMVLESTADAQPNGGRGSLVSIHIQQDTGELNLEQGKTYRLVDKAAAAGSPVADIYVWRRDGFIYFLTSESEPAMQMARAAFGAKEPTGTL
jgi:hypothetical protein